jgi:hypothetical protein
MTEETKEIQDSRKGFNKMVTAYLESNPILKTGPKGYNNEIKEFEIRFGSNKKLRKKITRIDYDNVIKILFSCGFKPDNIDGTELLRIRPEFTDKNTGQVRMSSIRTEIIGNYLIEEYCKTNSINDLYNLPSFNNSNLIFTQKKNAYIDDVPMKPIDIREFNIRASFQTERNFASHSGQSKDIIKSWNDQKKTFRYINRVRFSHPDYPLFVDMSIVKSSISKNRIHIPKYTIQESNVFDNEEEFEIEIELNNSDHRVGYYNADNKDFIFSSIKKAIRIILTGLQNTKFPVSYNEIDDIKLEYFKLLYGNNKDIEIPKYISSKYFIGPSSLTLQHENLIPDNNNNILENYTVTDKADGDRHLLFINKKGKIYMIDKNMDIIFTGTVSKEKKVFNTIFDGEFIKYDKNKNILNLYACFDIYYINGTDVRHLPFTYSDSDDTNDEDLLDTKKTRLQYLNTIIDIIKLKSIISNENKPTQFTIKSKVFYSTAENNIFFGCSNILSNIKDSLYEYNTDGLIFTPSNLPVGGNEINKPGPLKKFTWNKSFKWKPPEFNTIDFLVTTKKDETDNDVIHNVFVDGTSLDKQQSIIQYKTLILRCGYDEKQHGYMNPYQNIIKNELPDNDYNKDDSDTYKPVPFIPNNPYDENACFCKVKLINANNKSYMITEEGEYFEQDMIVEFYYDKTRDELFKWVPLRVRYDKTSELRATRKNFGNPFYVANNNWHTIHFPITEKMISTGEDISDINSNNDIYYNENVNDTITKQLRNIHNFLKKQLINCVSNKNGTLIDYSVGKGGDLYKWNSARLSFVYGIDISPDNIHNSKNGACARYLNSYKSNPKLPKVLFSVGKTNRTIIDGTAFDNEKDKQIANAIFGNGPKDKDLLGEGVYNNYGVAKNGFDIGSSQFTLHYYFETSLSLHTFLKNISDTIKVNGYFIGTCFDGKTVFDKLSSYQIDNGFSIYEKELKMFEIKKLYSKTGFPDDNTSLTYPISVYQESINQPLIEYLVNFNYFKHVMEDYGFTLISDDEANQLGIFKSTAMFSDYYDYIKSDIKLSNDYKKQYNNIINMSESEKKISFLNRYFIFKKIRNVDTNKVNKVLINVDKSKKYQEEEEEKEEKDSIENQIKPKAKKLSKKKIIIET